ncbi:MAG: flagellar hook-associated protein 3 [Frankiales bacterium]|jgi:flagellar hook-associated protein 3 FlgL|nr:flagellar hook-associated protein 3 [Frankiales bacterium]
MRVTEGSAYAAALQGVQSTSSKLAQLQSQMSSGRLITQPSDDPAGTASALALRGQLQRSNQYTSNASDAIGWLSAADTAFSSTTTQLQKVRTLVLQGLNTGANTGSSNSAIADQVDQIRSSLLALANTTYSGRPLFGGTTSGTVAFDSTGAYVGDSGTIDRAIGPNSTATVNSIGTDVYGANGSNLFDVLSTVSSDLRSNSSNLSADLNTLDSSMAQVSAAQGQEGAIYQRVQNAQTASASSQLSIKTQLSGLQDIDLASMAIQVTTANTAYQAALATTAKVQSVSLLDFLK